MPPRALLNFSRNFSLGMIATDVWNPGMLKVLLGAKQVIEFIANSSFREAKGMCLLPFKRSSQSVSYTHLDVYKRQPSPFLLKYRNKQPLQYQHTAFVQTAYVEGLLLTNGRNIPYGPLDLSLIHI